MPVSLDKKKIFVAGSKGMLGSSLVKHLQSYDCTILEASRKELDLLDQAATREWFKENKPDLVFMSAAKVGGIYANDKYPSSFLYENLMIEANAIEAAATNNVEKLLFVGSSCIYPKFAELPIKETSLLTGELEPTNKPYAVAKIAGIILCQAYKNEHGLNFVSAMPTNLYGPGDSFDLQNGHVVPSLIYKTHLAKMNNEKQIVIWGTGKPRRDIIHVDDCAKALIKIMQDYDELDPVNIGSGSDLSILEIAETITKALEWDGEFVFDESKPDGTLRKILDTTKLDSMGWKPEIDFYDGVKGVYSWLTGNEELLRGLVEN
jgi:GDP-L-fucose synthase